MKNKEFVSILGILGGPSPCLIIIAAWKPKTMKKSPLKKGPGRLESSILDGASKLITKLIQKNRYFFQFVGVRNETKP
jgi:hypothetical protein